MNKDCAIVIPAYKNSVSDYELLSLRRVRDVFENKYQIILVCSENLNVSFYQNEIQSLLIERFSDEFFSSYQNYSRTCMSTEFYQRFKQYKYHLIYQLDSYVFKDNLEYFINQGYDYYGAPLVNCPSWGTNDEIVGNGGCSLRKTEKFIQICKKFNETSYVPEDLYFCTVLKDKLNISSVDIALKFCFSSDTKEIYEYWFKRTNGELPSFVHIFKKNDTWDFWKKYINTSENMKIHFITFANSTSNFSFDRIKYEAEQMNCFESIETYTEKDFDSEYWSKNQEHFNGTRGYGYWSWKPYFINKKFSEIGDNEIVVYADTGCMLLKKNRDTLLEWCSRAKNSNSGILSPCYGPYIEHDWSKGDVYKYINDNYNKEHVDIFDKAVQCGAGILCISKNKKSMEFMKIWNDIMENHFDLITDSPSKYPNHPNFHENRHDQSVFSMLSKIFKIETVETRYGILDKQNSPIICTRIKNDKNTWKKPIRILYDNQIFDLQNFGGISRTFVDFSKITDKNEIYDNFTGCGNSIGAYNKVDSIFAVESTNNEHLIENGFKKASYKVSNYEYCEELKKKGDYDIFFPTFFNPHSIENIGNKPFIMFVPDMITELYPQYFSPNDMQIIGKKIMCPKASAIITCSENSKRDIVRILGIDENKVHVIPLNISQNFGIQIFNKPMCNFPYILYVGQRNAYKRFDLFLKYSMEFLNNHKEYKILFTGPKFNVYEIEYMRQLGLSERLAYYHPNNDIELASLYKYAKMFVYSSEYEGFGIPILESFRMGCPTLLNNRSCFPEVAKDAAIYFEMDDNKSNLSEKMEEIVNMSSEEMNILTRKQYDRLSEIQYINRGAELLKVVNKVIQND